MNTKLTTILKIIVAIATALLGTLGVAQTVN